MLRQSLIFVAHLIFWGLGAYLVTSIFGISSVEVQTETSNGVEETIKVTYNEAFVLATLVATGFSALLFYANVHLLSRYFKDKQLSAYLIKALLVLCFSLGCALAINGLFLQEYGGDDFVFLTPALGLHFGLFIFYTVVSFAYTFTREWYRNERLRSEITQQHLQTELDYLKYQVNPHFFFNTLNNLYSVAQEHQVAELANGIKELSNLMRYMLYETDTEFVPLSKEVKHIESFIEIQQLRQNENDDWIINFEKSGDFSKVFIAPMLLLPFVENAFKHGVAINKKSLISISVAAAPSEITFRAKNKIHQQLQLPTEASGIGLENVRRRLSLIYPDGHQLSIQKEQEYFQVELSIQYRA